MDRRALAVVVATAAGWIAGSLPRAAHASVDDEAADAVWGQMDFTVALRPSITSPASVSGAAGIATDSAHFMASSQAAPLTLLADREAHRVLVSSRLKPDHAVGQFGQSGWSEGKPNRGLGVPSSDTLDAPSAVAFTTLGEGSGINGDVAIADTGNNRVLFLKLYSSSVFSVNGVYGQHGDYARGNRNDGGEITAETLAAPEGVAFGDGSIDGFPSRLFVADTGNHRIVAYEPRAGTMALQCVGQADCEHGEPNRGAASPAVNSLNEPRGLWFYAGTSASDPMRGLYVADTGNHRVLQFRAIGDVISTSATRVWGQGGDFGSAVPSKGGPSATSLRSPTAVAVGPDGTLFVADTGHHRVLRFPKGASVADFVYGQPGFDHADPPAAPSATTLRAPMGVAVAASGMLMVSDTGHHRVLRWGARCDPAACADDNPCTDDACDLFLGCLSLPATYPKACAPYACGLAGNECATSCSVPAQCAPPNQCVEGRCMIPCEPPFGLCPSGMSCADGVCCNEDCDGPCESCRERGHEGTCLAVSGPPRHGHVCGEDADLDCRGTCDGVERKSCGHARDGSPCGVEACNDGVARLRGACRAGRCLDERRACAPYACGPAACRSSCDGDWQCADGAVCAGGACVEGPIPARGGGCAFADRPRAAYGLVSALAVALAAVGAVARRTRRRK